MAISYIGFDTETDLIKPGLLVPDLICGSCAWDQGHGDVAGRLLERSLILSFLRDQLSHDAHIVGANIAYDMAVCANADPTLLPLIFEAYDQGRIHDIQIRQALDAIAEGHLYKDPNTGGPLYVSKIDAESGKVVRNRSKRYSLATCCKLLLNKHLEKENTWRLRYGELKNTPIDQWPEEAKTYPVGDAVSTLECFLKQEEFEFKNRQDEAAQCRAAFALHLMAAWGVRSDPELVRELEKRVAKAREDSRKRFQEIGIYRKDGTKNSKKLAELVEVAYLGNPPRTKPGRIKTDRDTLYESGHDLLVEFAASGLDEKLGTTYLPVLEQGTKVPINAAYNVLVETGRVSCSSPNLMNLPRDGGVRECLTARPGYVLCSCDYSGIEAVTLAQVLHDLYGPNALEEAINSGTDMHVKTASGFVGVDYETLLAQVKSGDPAAKQLRFMAKAANFGFPGGMGEARLVLAKRKEGRTYSAHGPRFDQELKLGYYEGLRFCATNDPHVRCGEVMVTSYKGKEIPPTCQACIQIAKKLREAWFQAYPEMRQYFEFIGNLTSDYGIQEVQCLVSGRIRGDVGFCDGANTFFQALAADGAKAALWKVTQECYCDKSSILYGCRPIVFVHDELILEMPEAIAPEAALRLQQLMVETMKLYTPNIKVKAEPALMKHWSKEAEPVLDNQGRLTVWYPKKGK